jgi:hypothetical protein
MASLIAKHCTSIGRTGVEEMLPLMMREKAAPHKGAVFLWALAGDREICCAIGSVDMRFFGTYTVVVVSDGLCTRPVYGVAGTEACTT